MLAVRAGLGLLQSRFLVSSRNAPPEALRDDTKNECVAD